MIPYLLLLAIPLVFSFVAVDRQSPRVLIRLGSSRAPFMQRNNLALPSFFIALFVVLACRHETVGIDLMNYKYYFSVYPTLNIRDFDLLREESLFRLLNWLIGQFTDNYQIYLSLVAAITLLPIAWIYCEDRQNSYMKIAIFVSMSTFVMMFSGIRQMLAIACGVVAYMFTRKKQWIGFLLMGIIALGFHHSGFMVFAIYPLYHARFKRNHIWFILPIIALVFAFNRQVFGFANAVLASFNADYETEIGSTGAYMSLILFVLFAVFSYVVPDESKMDAEMFGLRNFLLLVVVLQCFAPLHSLAMRMNYYFIIFVPLAMGKLISIPRPEMKRVATLALIVLSLYFTYEFVDMVYTAYMTGNGALNSMPYRAFWE